MSQRRRQVAIVGRDAERDRLRDELRRAAGGEFRAVLLEGEPGIGKTRLATDLLAGAKAVALQARGYPLGLTSSFGLWAEALESHLRTLTPTEVETLCGGRTDDLAPLLRSAGPARPEHPDTSAARLLEGIVVVLRNLTGSGPVVVLLDDLHYADASSWEALDYIAHNLSRSSLLVIGCVRLGEVKESTSKGTVLRLEQEGLLERVRLGPLSRDDLGALAGEALPSTAIPQGLVRWLEGRSAGNPLFALALLDALVEEGGGLSAPALASVPRSLAERVEARLDGLSRSDRETIEVLAVLGRRAELPVLSGLLDRNVDQLGASLGSLVAVGLVTERALGRGFAYEMSHPLVAEVIYERTGSLRRRELHRRVGRALQELDVLSEAAAHFSRASDVGDEEAIAVLTEAARRAWSRRTLREALIVMRSLLELLPSGDERWLDVLDVMSLEGDWLYHGGDADFALGISIMRGIEPLLASSSDPGRSAAFDLHFSGFLGWGNGDHAEACERARRAVDLFQQAGDFDRARIAATELAWIVGVGGDLQAQERLARQALADADADGDHEAALHAVVALAATTWPRGRFEEAEEVFQRCIELSRRQGNVSRLRHSLASLALSRALEGRLDEARKALDEANATDPSGAASPAVEIGVFISWFCGELRAALDHIPPAVTDLAVGRSWVLMIGALAAAEAGDASGGQDLIEELEQVIPHRRFWLMRQPYRWAKGLLSWREGRLSRAVGELDAAATDLIADDCIVPAAHILVDLAEAAYEAQDTEATRTSARRLRDIAQRTGRDVYRSLYALADAWSALAAHERHDAAECARRAIELVPDGYRGLEGRALDVLGRALAADGDRPGATQALEGAAELFEACGSTWRLQRTMAALAGLGKRGRRAMAAAAGPSSLTKREREVVALAMDGLTAKEIGERLFIGERTVETHIANAYSKLGVRSRAELARLGSELAL